MGKNSDYFDVKEHDTGCLERSDISHLGSELRGGKHTAPSVDGRRNYKATREGASVTPISIDKRMHT